VVGIDEPRITFDDEEFRTAFGVDEVIFHTLCKLQGLHVVFLSLEE